MLFLKGGPFPPKRPGDDVRFSIAIDVADSGAFGVKVTVELLALPRDLCRSMQARGREESEEERFHGKPQNNAKLCGSSRTTFVPHLS
jgi:hypothetical protein